MKKAWLLIFVLLSLAGICLAQNNQYTIQGSGDINKSMAPEQRFQYPSFIQGKVVFKDGREAVAQLNYNWVLGDMQFINANGDTLSLTNEATLKYITLANDSFFYDKQYLPANRRQRHSKACQKSEAEVRRCQKNRRLRHTHFRSRRHHLFFCHRQLVPVQPQYQPGADGRNQDFLLYRRCVQPFSSG